MSEKCTVLKECPKCGEIMVSSIKKIINDKEVEMRLYCPNCKYIENYNCVIQL
ncbi:MAG: hypothetical protein QME14_09150 [Methanobacteriaceae archaeon]|nr:hypothetical protein [Methanobacteriaceae archaeon]